MCFEGELFPNEKICFEKWGKVLLNLMVAYLIFFFKLKIWIFAEETF